MKKTSAWLALSTLAAAAALLTGTLAGAQQQNTEKLKQMKVSGTDPNIPLVPQTGKIAAS